MPPIPPSLSRDRLRRAGSWLLIAAVAVAAAAAFAGVRGWLGPQRLSPQRIVDAFEANAGRHAGFRRNHAKGVCVAGWFDSNGAAAPYSVAAVFAPGRTPVVGRFAVPGGNPHAPDYGSPVRSLALQFTQRDGQQWRTAMNNSPVFVVATPTAFHAQLLANRPDPATGKPDPDRIAAFHAAHPETAGFRAWAKATRPSGSFAGQTYHGLSAFYLVDAQGARHPVRWRVVPERDIAAAPLAKDASAADVLAADLQARLHAGPLRWRLLLTLGAPEDPTADATRPWPPDRPTVDAGALVLRAASAQDAGACRDINYDPTVLPRGIRVSDDPLLAARSAAYADSQRRRLREQARASIVDATERSR